MSMNPKSVCVHETKRYLNQIATLFYTKMKVAFILNESKVHELYRKVAFLGISCFKGSLTFAFVFS